MSGAFLSVGSPRLLYDFLILPIIICTCSSDLTGRFHSRQFCSFSLSSGEFSWFWGSQYVVVKLNRKTVTFWKLKLITIKLKQILLFICWKNSVLKIVCIRTADEFKVIFRTLFLKLDFLLYILKELQNKFNKHKVNYDLSGCFLKTRTCLRGEETKVSWSANTAQGWHHSIVRCQSSLQEL